ncbi:unnamed protein product [Prorocentrum cordatum]|uniref:Uncharacterized protein n=1 Tax=Prorocentrum cordatum TaxID=2364126 RepID=A0ABN9TPS0_9DINO|nr:unnamed protein product [Polarella glacialis]
MLRVPVVTCSGRQVVVLDADPCWCLLDVLAAMPAQDVTPRSSRRLFFGEEELRGTACLADLGVESGCELTLVLTAQPDAAQVCANGSVKIFCVQECLHTLEGHRDHVLFVVLSPDGREIATASQDGTARVWSLDSGKCLRTLAGHKRAVRSAVFSPDGRFVVTASADSTAKIWSASSREALRTLLGHSRDLTSAMFSPDGQKVLTSSIDCTAKIWLAGSGECLHTLAGHGVPVKSALFSLDGQQVMTASWDLSAMFWSVDSGECVQAIARHLRSAAFVPQGTLYY